MVTKFYKNLLLINIMRLPHTHDLKDLDSLHKALNLLPHKDINGLATLSHQIDGDLIKLRINQKHNLEQILPDNYTITAKDRCGILFQVGNFRYMAFYQK